VKYDGENLVSIFFLSARRYYIYTTSDGGDGLVIPSWPALCWIAQGSGFESQRGLLFFGISPQGEISQDGFVQGWFPLLPQVDIYGQ
jgi:hypothetical protein